MLIFSKTIPSLLSLFFQLTFFTDFYNPDPLGGSNSKPSLIFTNTKIFMGFSYYIMTLFLQLFRFSQNKSCRASTTLLRRCISQSLKISCFLPFWNYYFLWNPWLNFIFLTQTRFHPHIIFSCKKLFSFFICLDAKTRDFMYLLSSLLLTNYLEWFKF